MPTPAQPLHVAASAHASDTPSLATGSVWPTAQQVAKTQRADRYTRETVAHPGKMLPAVARHAILTFTAPGELVADPMCGIGTTLIEAVHLGRPALGIEYEPRWARIARDNLALAEGHGATAPADVIQGDARTATADLTLTHRGRIRLLLTSPPYGSTSHGQVDVLRDGGVHKRDHRYSQDRRNLAHRPLSDLLAAFTEILRGCVPLLAPGGIVVITTRPFRGGPTPGELVDFPSLALDAAIAAGLEPFQRCVALLAGVRDGKLFSRAGFFHLHNIRQLRAQGIPALVAAHEDVLLLRRPTTQPSAAVPAPRELTAAGVP
jgi:modification methylase